MKTYIAKEKDIQKGIKILEQAYQILCNEYSDSIQKKMKKDEERVKFVLKVLKHFRKKIVLSDDPAQRKSMTRYI